MSATQQATQAARSKTTQVRTLADLDQLPDSALINEKESRLILGGISHTQQWRGENDGFYPEKIVFGPRLKRYNLGQVRACAKGEAWT